MTNKVAVCIIVRNENRYIREWVEYYKSIGFDNILMIDNNDIGGECLADVIGDYINDGFVKMYYRRGDNRDELQPLNYSKVYQREKDNYEWIAFFDADEFLDMSYFGNDIHFFLSHDFVKASSKVLFKWQLYGDNEQLYYEDKPVQERFPEPLPKDERYIKDSVYYMRMNFVKAMIHIPLCKKCCFDEDCENGYSIHNPRVESDYPCVTPNNWNISDWVNNEMLFLIDDNIPFDNAYLKHYYTKSLEEYFNRRCINNFKKHWNEGYCYSTYIEYNKDTPEKRLYYNILKKINKNEV